MRKRFLFFLITLLLLVPNFSDVREARAAGPNLVVNPSMETANTQGTAPADWQSEKWGNNTASFEYKTNGYQSNRSGYINMTARKTGDAKWYFTPVDVSPNTDYTFSDWYKSSVATKLVAMSLDSQNKATYLDIASLPASAISWRQATGSIKTPATSKKLTIFHLIEKVGWLQTDEATLFNNTQTPPPPPPPTTEIVPNYSVETVSSSNTSLPAKWSQDKWGQNTATYEYATNGQDGSRSIKLTVSNYVSGDAKWVFEPQVLTRGKDYKFSAWYKTNTIPHVVAQYIKDDGSEDFFGLPDPEPNGTGWQLYSDVFSVPSDVKAVSVFFFLSSNGWVQTDNYHITPYSYPAFTRGLVTLTFDDGFEDNITNVLPVLDQYGLKTTQCYATQYIAGQPQQIANVQTFAQHGHEICSHTVTHPDLTTLTTAQLTTELTQSKNFLASITGQSISNFASPFGAYNAQVNNEIKKYYSAHRTTDEGFNAKDNIGAYRLRVQNMQINTTQAQFQAWVNKAKADKTWLILLYHRVGTTGLGQFDTNQADFNAQMQWLTASGAVVRTWKDALTEAQSQMP